MLVSCQFIEASNQPNTSNLLKILFDEGEVYVHYMINYMIVSYYQVYKPYNTMKHFYIPFNEGGRVRGTIIIT